MRASDLFVLPSRIAEDGDRDGLPNVLMEAASQLLPILSTPVSAIPEFIDTGTHGLLSADTPAALADAILENGNQPCACDDNGTGRPHTPAGRISHGPRHRPFVQTAQRFRSGQGLMARVAFYSPMKAPDSPVPSGDREMARNLIRAIGAQGDEVYLASRLRIYDKTGDIQVQQALSAEADAEAQRLVADMSADTNLWVTYHNYYKAPDLVGPKVCAARGIPYVQLESTRATSRLRGPWSGFAQAAHDACDAAQVIFYHTANDLITLERERFADQQLIELPPFLPITELPHLSTCDGPMLTVGMMRYGDKLASYDLLAKTLKLLTGDWVLHIAGDGTRTRRSRRTDGPVWIQGHISWTVEPGRIAGGLHHRIRHGLARRERGIWHDLPRSTGQRRTRRGPEPSWSARCSGTGHLSSR